MRENMEAQRELSTEIERLQHIARETERRRTDVENQLRAGEKVRVAAQAKLERLHAKARLFGTQKTILKSPDRFDPTFQNLKSQEQQLKE
jgi:hypothetical protein